MTGTLAELRRVLDVARDVPGPLPPPRCLGVRIVVRAARLLREHPVVRTMAVTGPEFAHTAVLLPTTDWHATAWSWLCRHVTTHLPMGAAQDTAALAVLTTALPYALTPPPDSPDPAAGRASIDHKLSLSLHLCLDLPATCPDCQTQDVR